MFDKQLAVYATVDQGQFPVCSRLRVVGCERFDEAKPGGRAVFGIIAVFAICRARLHRVVAVAMTATIFVQVRCSSPQSSGSAFGRPHKTASLLRPSRSK